MWEQGKLVGAGPIAQDGDLRGIVLFSGVTLDEAKALAEQDPKVKAGVLQVELHPWMAATGIGVAYNQRVAKGEQPSMITLYLGFLRAAKDAPTDDRRRRAREAAADPPGQHRAPGARRESAPGRTVPG